MTALIFALAFIVSAPGQQPCVGDSRAPSLDHVVIAVRDLESASGTFRARGFRLKQGRLHANGLLNRHVKFRNGTSIELMTVRGEPGDSMAKDYTDFLTTREGGVYLALGVPTLDTVARAASALRFATRTSSSGPFSFLSFPVNEHTAPVFFSSGNSTVQDPDSLLLHTPDVIGVVEVWLEAGPQFVTLLQRLGARRCGQAISPYGFAGDRFGLSEGSVIIMSSRTHLRPVVRGVTLQLRAHGRETTVWPHPDFWVHYRIGR